MFDSQYRLMFFYTSYPYAAFAAHTINCLPDPEIDGFRCCTHECAPCEGLLILHEAGTLGEAVTPYLAKAGFNVDWWDKSKNDINWDWIKSRLCDPETCPVRKWNEDEENRS